MQYWHSVLFNVPFAYICDVKLFYNVPVLLSLHVCISHYISNLVLCLLFYWYKELLYSYILHRLALFNVCYCLTLWYNYTCVTSVWSCSDNCGLRQIFLPRSNWNYCCIYDNNLAIIMQYFCTVTRLFEFVALFSIHNVFLLLFTFVIGPTSFINTIHAKNMQQFGVN